jgi:hypothetical protein
MGFSAKLLNPGEQVAIDVRPHWKYLAGPVFAVAVALAGSIAALVDQVPHWAELVLAGVLVVCLAWLAGRYLRWTTTSFVVTTERVVLRRGVLRRSGREILLDRLADISYRQTLPDRLLRCGDLLLESPGRDSPEVFADLPRPVAIQTEINRLINQRRAVPLAGAGGPGFAGSGFAGSGVGGSQFTASEFGPGPPGPGTPAATGELTLADQLTQLDDLRRRGVISRREFSAKKSELLSRM